ncbi:TonB-dependent receptor [Ancylomarina longa]|uniref:TonB-dependent receptor n=1 Tax=Ancylomarina longa TaxID=2487017 RepID=A0A434AZP6_9BACT|nr:TonB-dependent receptor [Ancylomarina longa]RUT80102.1 TonB-dependent receptor [Ancylomarina longa]
MRFFYTMFLLNFITVLGTSQTVKVIDKTNIQPIENVYIFSNNKSMLTNKKGEADISAFGNNEILIFQHSSFENDTISYENLKRANFKIKLSESILKLNEVIVSANRWEQNKKEVPNKIATISTKEIKFTNPQTTADLLGTSNEVFIQKSQMGGGSPMIRGFATNRILIVVDGVRMNNAIYRSGNLQNIISLDANSIENAEVIFGPGSVIYGSDAIGGVMDFHTLRPKLTTTDKLDFTANALSRYSSANNEKTGHLNFNFGTEKWSFLSSITHSNFGDLKMGSKGNHEYVRPEYVTRINGQDYIMKNDNENIQKYSGYNQMNVMQKIRFRPNEKLDINYGFHCSKLSDVPRYDRLIQYKKGKLKYANWYYGPQKWMMNILNVKYSNSTKLFDEAKLIIAYQNYEESRHDRKFGKDEIRERTEKVKAFSANLDFDKQLNQKSFLFYGLEAVTNKVNSSGQKRNIETKEITPHASRYPDDSNYTSYAGYLNYKNNLNTKMTFIAGIRYSRILLDADFDTTFYKFSFNKISINTGALNGSIGLVFRPNKSWQFNLNTSTGFRAPNIDDIGKTFDSEPGNVVVPNKDLNSEYAYNIDFGIIKTINDKIQIEATGFYTLLKDAMVRRNFTFDGQDSIMYDGELSRVQALVNADKAKVYGIQLGLYADIIKYLSFKTNLTYTKGEDQDGVPLRHVAPLFGSTHIILKAEKIKADLYANYNGKISNENLAPSEQNKTYMYATNSEGKPYSPSWFTLNLKASYQLNKLLQVNAGIENISDKRYRPYSSGIAAPGRNFILGLRGSF